MPARPVCALGLAIGAILAQAKPIDIEKLDPRMAVEKVAVDSEGVQWIDGRQLPIEGRAFDDVANYYDRLPAAVTTNVNLGVRIMRHHTSGMQFRFVTDSKTLRFRWKPFFDELQMPNMPMPGVSGIDVYRFDVRSGRWRYVKTGRVRDKTEGGALDVPWTPSTPCLVNLPLYNGIREFSLGIDRDASVKKMPPRKSGVDKPVVFYGTSITHGGCASRPGMGFVNWLGRDLDVPIVNLGFSGSGVMEFEMCDHLSRIEASCYVLDCLWNMSQQMTVERYEPFIRRLRAKRPHVPIVMACRSDVFCEGDGPQDKFVKTLYRKLVAEGWNNLVLLPKNAMFADDGEGTVDGSHPNDYGMRFMALAYGKAVKKALKLK